MIVFKFIFFMNFIYSTLELLMLIENVKTSKHNKEIENDSLRLVTVVMRHGERAPQDTYPNDPYLNNSMEPYGWGQLTNEGRRNQYNQAVDRTKMSAMLEAAALWKPTEKQSFKRDLAWQPVTLFYQPRSEDTLMLIWDTCPKYAKLRHAIMNLPEVQQIQDENKQFYKELTNLTGMVISTPNDVNSLYGTLTAEKHMNLILPKWTKNYYPDKLIPLTLYDFQLNVYNDFLKRLKGGPFLKKIITDMLAKKNNTLKPEVRKMFMYIGHDSTIVTLMDVMHVWNNQMPNYNIMIMIELHENNDEWNVQIFLRNTTEYEPYPLTIPGCTTICPLEKFIQILNPMIPDNWNEECKVNGEYKPPPAPLP
ncbi:lysosomal acid phosphatase isoform X2 [Apis mellifera]|uniref:Lysosomal acid phosphatase isoform X2 n=1 Tax=Apis mellifera TaxID=7460 RepID=A0A7M7GWS9_APIME|nr:lysosomal acid phosphatase isoform X2 [Apis mellifera]|eukprot:XP_006564906.1 lysosomal acid phosphatase isoform X2 [Apis mellifera]